MGSVRKRGKGFQALWREEVGGKLKQRGLWFPRERDAREHLAKVELGLAPQPATSAQIEDKRTFADYVYGENGWLRTKRRAISAKSDVDYTASLKNHIVPVLGDIPLAEITRAHVNDLIDTLMTKPIKGGGVMSPATVRKTFRVVQGVLRSAEEEELIARNPCPGIDLPKVGPKPEIVFLTVDQVDDLAESHPGRYQALVRLGAFGGLRASELAGLKESRLHFPQHNVVVAETLTEVRGHLISGTPKSGRARIVHLEDDMLEELARHVSMYPPTPQGYVFSSPTGMPIRHRNYYERVFLPACRKAGLPIDTEFKSLRHTYAAMAISSGTNIYQVQQQMGHSSVDVTGNIYGHLYHQDLEAYRERLLAFRRQAKAKRIERRGLSIVS